MNNLPTHLEFVRRQAALALAPIKPADGQTSVDDQKFLFRAKKLEASRGLPAYYLVYFLLADLLGFRNLGRFEKIAWSIPLDFKGRAFLVEHAKFGLRLCGQTDSSADEEDGREIVMLIRAATKVAEPYYDWIADQALGSSQLNVLNTTSELFARYLFFRNGHRAAAREAEDRKGSRLKPGNIVESAKDIDLSGTWIDVISRQPVSQAKWLALAAIDAFFSWTEQAFIHIAILRRRLTTGTAIAFAANADWSTKFKYAIDLHEPGAKRFYDELLEIRRQLRNYMAHGAFGKQGEVFSFHSSAGAVPLVLPHRRSRRVSFKRDLSFVEPTALAAIDSFLNEFLWSGDRRPAEKYILDSELPLILTFANDGTFAEAITSVERMAGLVEELERRFQDAANMDW